ncbi:hypothetical protein LCGC14_0657670 [marine sediment metagenome]|uniref:Uncharacterized protein n=1 Tax=marine sediment metagenome TaxID=412755 RepID=A0A0F9U2U9_9ZZZZ
MTENELAPGGHEEPEKPDTPAWDALVEEMMTQFCGAHISGGNPHDTVLQRAALTAFLAGLMLGVDIHFKHSYDAELLLAEYISGQSPPALYSHMKMTEDVSELVRTAHMGHPDGR